MKQSLDATFDNSTPLTGSIPSPAASQMSNMSNPTKFIKLIGGRDRGRKAKSLKVLFHNSWIIMCFYLFPHALIYCILGIWAFSLLCRCLLGSLVLEVLGHYLKTRLFCLLGFLEHLSFILCFHLFISFILRYGCTWTVNSICTCNIRHLLSLYMIWAQTGSLLVMPWIVPFSLRYACVL